MFQSLIRDAAYSDLSQIDLIVAGLERFNPSFGMLPTLTDKLLDILDLL